jgi:hypothetical protein
MILEKKPFSEDNDGTAMEKLKGGDRADIQELEAEKCILLDLIIECWYELPEERPTLAELRREAEDIRLYMSDIGGGEVHWRRSLAAAIPLWFRLFFLV